MKTVPKPKHCGQNWLDMTLTEGGRICGKCDKKIVDFSKSNWAEIEKLQIRNNNSLCGMYNPKQLENWGREIPGSNNSFLKAAVITGSIVSFSASGYTQEIGNTDSLVIEGRIIDGETGETLPFALVELKNNKVKGLSDLDGNFRLVLKNIPATPMPDTLEVSYVGIPTKSTAFTDMKQLVSSDGDIKIKDGKVDITLSDPDAEIIMFYVNAPKRGERMKRKIKGWFQREKD